MRVTGAADPTVSVKETMKGKLPQKKLVRSAAHGYSSYGNQIGLATGYCVKEIYHPDYVAKRMEIGAVMGAAPRREVSVKLRIREISSFFWADVPDVMAVVEQPVLPKFIPRNPLRHVVLRFRREMPTERKIQRMFRREVSQQADQEV